MEDKSKFNVALPAELVIGETTYVVKDEPELKAFVTAILTKAQQTERGKLYDKIQKLENDLVTISQERDDKARELANVTVAPKPTEPITKANMKEDLNKANADTPLTIDQISAIIDKKFSDALPELLKNQIDPLAKKLAATEKSQLDAYREKRLSELGDTIVPELVRGATREEIEQSIVESTAIRQRYTPTQPTTPVVPTEENPAPPVQHIPKPVSRPVQLPDEHVEDVKNMGLDEFSKKREDMLKKLGKENIYQPLNS